MVRGPAATALLLRGDVTRTARRLRLGLVKQLQANGVIHSVAVADALASVARELFIPEVLADEGLEGVYRDQAFVTRRDPRGMPLSSSSQPALMGTMLELLDLRAGQRVLEIGAGAALRLGSRHRRERRGVLAGRLCSG
jgi:Protein-L-isoaspartate(D-aspartate) O-methyltransferase (PCMT)